MHFELGNVSLNLTSEQWMLRQLIQEVKSNLGGHAVAGVEDGFVIVLRSLIEAVSTGFTVSHLKQNTKDTYTLFFGLQGALNGTTSF